MDIKTTQDFLLVPVIDLMGGQVVHAVSGMRDQYKPLESVLCNSSQPKAVLEGLLSLYPFQKIYFADLDAILGVGTHFPLLIQLSEAYPELEFWVDGGFKNMQETSSWHDGWNRRAILGTESLVAQNFTHDYFSNDVLLSIDFRGQEFLGPQCLWADSTLWPNEIISMNLLKVGSYSGVDISKVQELKRRAPECMIYSAGGVSDQHDLRTLVDIGAAGVLLSSALHKGVLSRNLLAAF